LSTWQARRAESLQQLVHIEAEKGEYMAHRGSFEHAKRIFFGWLSLSRCTASAYLDPTKAIFDENRRGCHFELRRRRFQSILMGDQSTHIERACDGRFISSLLSSDGPN